MKRSKPYRVLHLGAGVQSGAIYSLMARGEIEPADVAVFADTQEEPEWVYRQLNYCKLLRDMMGGPPIVEVTAGRIGDDLINGVNSTGEPFASIPAHTTYQEGQKGGLTRRQCTREYKIAPIERWIRAVGLGITPSHRTRKDGRRIEVYRLPKGVQVESLFGFSTDESNRAVKMQGSMAGRTQWSCGFPLFHPDVLMTRHDSMLYIVGESGFIWRSSRCVFCPLQANAHWKELKQYAASGWNRAIHVDESLRTTGAIANRDMNETMYVHKSNRPLSKANLDESQQDMFAHECENGCFL